MDSWAIVAVFALIAWVVVRSRHGSRQAPGACRPEDEEYVNSVNAKLAEVDSLRERVEVLERIVTDKGYALRREFDQL